MIILERDKNPIMLKIWSNGICIYKTFDLLNMQTPFDSSQMLGLAGVFPTMVLCFNPKIIVLSPSHFIDIFRISKFK